MWPQNWFTSPTPPKTLAWYDDSFCVVNLDQVEWTSRVELDTEVLVGLCSNVNKSSQQAVTYYEVVYRHKEAFSFLVYHNTSKQDAIDIFNNVKITLNLLTEYFTTNKLLVADNLQSIMQCLRINKNWTCAHVCARLGFDLYFSGKCQEAINSQVEPDRDTSLHLAIKCFLLPTVRSILAQKPNFALVNSRKQSVLHYAAISTQEIVALMLAQADMMERVLWKDVKGCTALHLACYIQKFDIVFEFLKFGLTVRMLTLSPPGGTVTGKETCAEEKRLNEIVRFSEQDFDDIDCQDIFSGGCPMHWVKHKRLMDKLLTYGFPFNARNIHGDTPLHNMSKRLRLKCVMSLLCAGANVNASNIFGNTPLHVSVKKNDLVVPQTLIVFDANIDAKNFNNETVRHVAAKACKSTGNETILYLLSALGAKRCPKREPFIDEQKLCNHGCSFNGDFEGNIGEKLYGVDQKYDRLFKDFLFGDILKQNENRTPEEMKKERGVNMLCLDGGGIKGLVSLQMLKEVERYLRHPLHHYFKWYAGTSTGSFICAFLAMGKSLNQIRAIYFRIKEKVFVGAKPYLSESFEKMIIEQVGEDIKMDEIRTKYDKYLVIPSMIANRRPMKLHLFRSFPSAEELFEQSGQANLQEQLKPDRDKDLKNYQKYESSNIEVWKACRASGAAPTYIRAYGNFLDGGIVANNPTLDALAEFQQYNCALRAVGQSEQCQKLDLVLSIGTGKGMLEESVVVDIASNYSAFRQCLTIIELLIYEVTQTEQHIVHRAESMCSASNVPYFRLNSFLSEVIELDEQQDYKIIQCLWETKRFMYYRRDQVKVLVNYLEKCTQGLPATPSKELSQAKCKSSKSQSAQTKSKSSTKSTQSGNNQSNRRSSSDKDKQI